jgi:hypothetical protein
MAFKILNHPSIVTITYSFSFTLLPSYLALLNCKVVIRKIVLQNTSILASGRRIQARHKDYSKVIVVH